MTNPRTVAVLAFCLALACPAVASEPEITPAAREEIFEDALPPSPTLAERIAEIRLRVQEAVRYPARARSRGVMGVAHIRFAIGIDGLAQEIETVRTSGSSMLDQAAEQGARDAGRLPYVYGRVEVPIRFSLDRSP
jgi:TonB family protein